jgi:ATP-dependent RNA helicase DeaD
VPCYAESYTHRIGRTGRAGREGDAITLVSAREMRLLKTIEKGTRSQIRPVRLPTTADVAVRRREVFKQSVIDGLKEGGFEDFLVTVDELAENYQPSEVAAAALKLLWGSRNPPQPRQQLNLPALGNRHVFDCFSRSDTNTACVRAIWSAPSRTKPD